MRQIQTDVPNGVDIWVPDKINFIPLRNESVLMKVADLPDGVYYAADLTCSAVDNPLTSLPMIHDAITKVFDNHYPCYAGYQTEAACAEINDFIKPMVTFRQAELANGRVNPIVKKNTGSYSALDAVVWGNSVRYTPNVNEAPLRHVPDVVAVWSTIQYMFRTQEAVNEKFVGKPDTTFMRHAMQTFIVSRMETLSEYFQRTQLVRELQFNVYIDDATEDIWILVHIHRDLDRAIQIQFNFTTGLLCQYVDLGNIF